MRVRVYDNRKHGNERQREEFEQMSASRNAALSESEVVNADNTHEWKRTHWGEYDIAPTGNKMYGDVYTILRPEQYKTRQDVLELKQRIREDFPNAKIHVTRPGLFDKYLFGENRGKYKPIYVDRFRVPGGKWIDENPRLELQKIEYTIPEIASVPVTINPLADIERVNSITYSWASRKKMQEEAARAARERAAQNQHQQIPQVEIQQDIKEFLDNYYNNNVNNFLTEFGNEYKNQNKYNVTGDTRDEFEKRGGHPNVNSAISKDDTLVQNFSNDMNKKANFEINNTPKNKLIRSYYYNASDNTLEESTLYTPYGTPVNDYFDMNFKYPQHIQQRKELLNEAQNKFDNNYSDLADDVDNYLSNKYFEYIKDKSSGFKTVPFERVTSPKESKVYFPLEKIKKKQLKVPAILKEEKVHKSEEPEFIKKQVRSLDANGDVVIQEKMIKNPNYKGTTRETTGYKLGNTSFNYESYSDVDFNNNIEALFKNTTYYPQEVENSSEATQLKKAYGVNSLDKARKINTLLRARIFNKENGIFTTPENVDSVINEMSNQELKNMFNGIHIPGFNPNNMNMKEIRKYLIFLASNDSDSDVNYANHGGVLDATYNEQISRIRQPRFAGWRFKNGGIYIKEENRGKFTEAANRAGMGVQEYARHILANRENYSPTMVKRANFARNASKWKHADGGDVPPFKSFDDWYRSIYHNANDTTDYNLRRAYELAPIGELEAWRSDPDKNHLHTGYWNGDVYEFMKSKDHPTVNYELDWYNSPDADDFRSRYMLDTTTGNYKYVPRYKVKVTF